MPAQFLLHRTILHRWHFTLVDYEGTPVAVSDHFPSRDAAIAGIRAVREAAVDADVVDLTSE